MANRPPERSGASYSFGGRGRWGRWGRLGAKLAPPIQGRKRSFPAVHLTGAAKWPRHYIGRPRRYLTHEKAGPTSACGRARMILADNSRKASDRRRRFDLPKKLYVQIRGARRNLRASLICPSRAPGPCRSAYKLTIPAAWLMRGVLPFARKCADQCQEAADRSKLE